MDWNDFWQENKRAVTSIALGLLVFAIAVMVRDSFFESEIGATRARITRLQRELAEPLFTAAQKTAAEEDNAELTAAVEALREAVSFRTREEFRIDVELGSLPNQYLRALTRVREDLLPLANRANLIVDSGLGMPKLSPTREAEIERYLQALDVIDVVLRDAIGAGVARVDEIQIRLDPGLTSRAGLGTVERTRVEFTVAGDSQALTRLLSGTQRVRDGRHLLVGDVELVPARGREDQLRLDLTVVIARIAEAASAEEEV